MNEQPAKRVSWIQANRKDVLTALFLGLIFSVATFHGADLIPSVLLTDGAQVDNIWFEADTSRVYTVMTDRFHPLQSRSSTHPLFALVSFPLVLILKKLLHLNPVVAVRLVTAGVAFLWMSAVFTLLRMLGCRRLDAVLFSALAGVSAAGIFFFVVPETFSFGSLTILIALCAAVISQRHLLHPFYFVLVNVMTLSMTITNWMAGMAVTLINHSIRRTFQIIVYAFFTASVLWSIQKVLFPAAKFFFDFNREAKFMLLDGSGGLFHVAKSFFFHTLIMPSIYVMDKFAHPDWPLMLTQISGAGSATIWGRWAVVLWTLLLGAGLWSLLSLKTNGKFRLALGLLIAGQLAMHTVYGDETFLYALHFIVLLIPLAALTCLTRRRPAALILTAILIPCVLANNLTQFTQVLDFFKYHGMQRQQLRMQIHFRPQDPWPRNQGHVVLALPGTDVMNKAYHEPGGSFSPAVGSFGVSIWVLNKQGRLMTTSDTIPLKTIQQKFVAADPIPAILTKTKHYEARWSSTGPGGWRLDLHKTDPDVDLMLVVRSVGPAGGIVHSLTKTQKGLAINDRWDLTATAQTNIYLGDETQAGWTSARTPRSQWKANRGWGYAKFPVTDDVLVVNIQDRLPVGTGGLEYRSLESPLKVSVPDPMFIESLEAQRAHILMALVDRQTRPGDPVSYQETWQHEAAYSVVALAKAGDLQIARQLSTYLAEHDFFSGFGTETDGPGLEIWALKEVADRVNDLQFVQHMWPHIQRKAGLIEQMLTAKKTMHEMYDSQALPIFDNEAVDVMSQAALAAQDGLINGRISQQFPKFYINAVGYLGLRQASAWAQMIGDTAASDRWQGVASNLQKVWIKAYQESPENPTNAYTYASGLWPSHVAEGVEELFARNLKTRWEKTRDHKDNFYYPPSKMDLAVAEAHQWLFLGDVGHTWRSLHSLWAHQTSPGLYTWAETVDKGYTYNGWDNVRGWRQVGQVTPHNGTAAELLSLQIDMLGYLKDGDQPQIVIAAGVPATWLQSSIDVKGLSLPHRTIDWHWDAASQKISVTISGQSAAVKLGPSFSPQTVLEVRVNP